MGGGGGGGGGISGAQSTRWINTTAGLFTAGLR